MWVLLFYKLTLPHCATKCDNTVRENKNNGCLKMMALLLAKSKMDFVSVLFPRVGHSHGSLGAFDAFKKPNANHEISGLILRFAKINSLGYWLQQYATLI